MPRTSTPPSSTDGEQAVAEVAELLTPVDLGVLQHVHVGHGGTSYHLLRRAEPHLHASCATCAALSSTCR